MDPMLIALLVAYVATNGAKDVAFAVRGKESPRQARRRIRLQNGVRTPGGTLADAAAQRLARRVAEGKRARSPKPPKPVKTGFRKFVSEFNADVWDDATTKRRRLHERRVQRRTDRQARKTARRTPPPTPQGPAVHGDTQDTPDMPDPVTTDAQPGSGEGQASDQERQLVDDYRCPWPLDDAAAGLCGQPAADGQVYCAEHNRQLHPEQASPAAQPVHLRQVAVPEGATQACPEPGCTGVMSPIPGSLNADDTHGSVRRACDTCDRESVHTWPLPVPDDQPEQPEQSADIPATDHSPSTPPTGQDDRTPAALDRPPSGPPEPRAPADPLATVTRIRTDREEPVVSATTAGEGGLAAYVAYVEQMIEETQKAISSAEATAADAESKEWAGPAVEGLRKAQEAYAAAIAGLQEAQEGFAAGQQVADAYSAAPGTGSKESVLAG